MKRLLLAVACLLAFACLASAAGAATPIPNGSCPNGRAQMGCNVPPAHGVGVALVPNIQQVPDVSDNNGPVDWPQVKGWQIQHHWTPAGIFKMGEFVTDPLAEANSSELHTLGMRAIGYWFVRPTGCGHEAGQIISAARSFGVHVVVNDTEVPGLQSYPSCLAGRERAAGLKPVDYTASGTWFNNDPFALMVGVPLWDATYGASPDLTGLWTTHWIAWQFTETGLVPGITGNSDISVSRGLVALAKPNVMHYERYDTRKRFGDIIERRAVESWDRDKCENPVRRRECWIIRAHLQLLRARLVGLHASGKRWSYGSPWNIGARNQQLWTRINTRHLVRSWGAGL